MMDHCFLFTKHLDDQSCLCLKMSSEGRLLEPAQQRSFSEIKSLQKECSTTVVETSLHAALLSLELPWLSERKARLAIPYALEDKVAQSLEKLHFAFDTLRYENNHYLITVIDKERMHYIIQILDLQGIEFNQLTLDWFALSPQELSVNEEVLLIHHDDFKGALTGELALTYLKKNSLFSPPLVFEDSSILLDQSFTKSEGSSYPWIAQKLLKTKPMNLCQGDMAHGTRSAWISKGYQWACALFLFWLLSLLIVNAISLHFLNKKTAVLDEQIAVIYKEFFPEAKQVISPKFRIGQLLNTTNQDAQPYFWHMMNQLAKGIKNSSIKVDALRYQNKTLSVTLICPDFSSLEQLENKLKQLQLKVKQTQASTKEQHVLAILELS